MTRSRTPLLLALLVGLALPTAASANTISITRTDPVNNYSATRGLQRSLTATVLDGVGSPVSGAAVAYRVTDPSMTPTDAAAAATDAQGKTALTFTPVSGGYYTIIACVDDNPANGSCDAAELTSAGFSDYAYNPTWTFSPTTTGFAIGSNPTLTVTLKDANGHAIANQGGVKYQVTGTNTQGPTGGTTDGSGQFTVGWTQSNAGSDTLSTWWDLNGNGNGPPQSDYSDPYSSEYITFTNGSMYAYGATVKAGVPSYSATVTLYDPDGTTAAAGLTVNYTITSGTSGHSGSGTVQTNASGQVQIPWPSTTLTYPSSDTLDVYYDYPGSTAGKDANDPQDTANITFRGPYTSLSGGLGSRVVGGTRLVSAYALFGDGTTDPGAHIHWYTDGGHQGDVIADGSGQGQFSFTSSTPGTETLHACVDENANGACDSGEDAGSGSSATWYSGIFSSGPVSGIRWDTNMSCQAEYAGDPSGEFFGGDVPASCYLAVYAGGSLYTSYTGGSQGPITGSGTTDDPFRQTTTATVSGISTLTISETTTYVVGQDLYRTEVTLVNGGADLDAYLYQYSDCFLQGSDQGFGFYDQATGGAYCSAQPNNTPASRIEGFVPVADYHDSSYSWYEAGYSQETEGTDTYPSVYSAMDGDGLPSRCLCTRSSGYNYDNAMAIGWHVPIPAGGSVTRAFFTSFSPVGSVTDTTPPNVTVDAPADGSTTTDDTPTIAGSASSRSTDALTIPVSIYSGSSASGTPIQTLSPMRSGGRWSTDATHLAPGTYTVQARQSYVFGSDRVSNTRTFNVVAPPPTQPPSDQPLPPPVFRQSVNVAPVDGTVFVTEPGGKKVQLTSPDQIKLGSIIDTTDGRVRLTIADKNGKLQSAEFYEGVFKVTQLPKKKGGSMNLKLVGGNFKACPAAKKSKKSRASRAKKLKKTSDVQHLWGSGTGSFRTQGRYSAASVRGTTWLTDDRCDGTLTRVTSGQVAVHDDVRNKTIVLKKGQKYLATPR